MSTDTHSRLTPPTSSPAVVAAVHKDAEIRAVKLRDSINLRPRYAAVVTAYTDVKPSHDTEVAIEPRILSENEMCENRPVEFERAIVARTEAMWSAIDGWSLYK